MKVACANCANPVPDRQSGR